MALDALAIEAPDRAAEAVARRAFSRIAPGAYDPLRVLAGVDRLLTTGLFEAVWPRVEERGPASVLILRVETPPRVSVVGGAGYDTDRGGRAWGAVQHYGGLGTAPLVLTGSASLDPLSRWTAASARILSPRLLPVVQSVGVFGQETDVRRFGAEGPLRDQEVRRIGGWWGLELPELLHARAAVLTLRAERVAIEGGDRGFAAGPTLRLAESRAKPPVVGTGNALEVEARWGAITYRRVALHLSRERQLSALRLAAVAMGAAASAGAPPDVVPALGDEHAFPGFRWGEGRGSTVALAGIDAACPALRSGFLRARLRVGALGDRPASLADSRRIAGAELGAVWRAPFGALSLTAGRNTQGRGTLILDVGSPF